MKIGVTGSRVLTYDQRKEARRILTRVLSDHAPYGELHHGCANGIDLIAAQVAASLGMKIVEYPVSIPNWEAGYKPRNKRLVNAVDFLLAMHSSESKTGGTIWTYQYAQRKGVPAEWIPL